MAGKSRKKKDFIKYYLPAALLSGMFLGVGINPEQAVAEAFIKLVEDASSLFAIVLRIILVVGGIVVEARLWRDMLTDYGFRGLASALCVFLGVILVITTDSLVGAYLFLIGILVARFIVQPVRKRSRR